MDEKIDRGASPKAENNPSAQSAQGAINPSAPSAGTAAWGTTPDEKRMQVGKSNPEASSSEAQGAGDVRHTSYPQNEAEQNPAAEEFAHPHGDRSFRCSDAVEKNCGWSVTGNNEDEILGYLRAHAREAHSKNEFTPEELSHARRAIQKRAA